MSDSAPQLESVQFGAFTLWPIKRRLERNGQTVRIGSRAFEILVTLVERAGEIVPHRELQDRAWPGLTVDESALRVHVAGLRKALGQRGRSGFIANVPGRGYSFAATIGRFQAREAEAPVAGSARRRRHLPACPKSIIGRDATIDDIAARVLQTRFVTIVAPGGVGKTTVAIAASCKIAADFDGEAFFVNFGTVSEQQLIVPAVATTLGISIQSDDPLASLAASLGERRLLLLLDNCEHQIEAIAVVAERISADAPEVHILATSREALRVDGEHVVHLRALDVPPDNANLAASEALGFPSVQLFVERVRASGAMASLTDADATTVAHICRHLDGLPLAIELVAGRVAALGTEGIAAHIEDPLKLQWRGRRTAPPRHQTLGSMLDWSYRLLSEAEQLILRRLSILRGPFDLEAARAVAADERIGADELIDGVAGLVGKSLLSTAAREGQVTYRLLDITQAYALEKLARSGEAGLMSRRLARYMARTFADLATDGDNASDASFQIVPHLRKV